MKDEVNRSSQPQSAVRASDPAELPEAGPTAPGAGRLLHPPAWLTYPVVNFCFTIVCFASPSPLGSFGSVVFQGAILWCVLVVSIGWLKLSREPHVLQLTAVMWAFVAAHLVSAAVNGWPEKGLREMLWLWTFLSFPLVYASWSIAHKDDIVKACVGGSVLACHSALVLAVIQLIWLHIRPEGGAGNAIVFATVTTMAATIALLGAFRFSGYMATHCLLAFVSGVVAVSLSGTRGIWPAVLLNALIVFALHRGHGRRLSRSSAAAAVAALLLIAVAFGWIAMPRFESALMELESAVDENYDTPLGLRFAMWAEGARAWLEKPIFGHGPGFGPGLLAAEIREKFGVTVFATHWHNVFLNTLVSTGIVGLASLLAMVALPVLLAVRTLLDRPDPNRKFGAAMLIVLIVTYVTAGLSSIMLGHDILDCLFIMSAVVGSFLARGRPRLRTGEFALPATR